MTVAEYVTEARRIRDERKAEREQKRNEKEQQRQTRLNEILADIRLRLIGIIPEPLRSFLVYAGFEPSDADLKNYPSIWTPCDFAIEGAPGLARITFTTEDLQRVRVIHVGADDFGDDWQEAVAEAADRNPSPARSE